MIHSTLLYQLYSTDIKIMQRCPHAKWVHFAVLIRHVAPSAQAAGISCSDFCCCRFRAYICSSQPMSKLVMRNDAGTDAGTKPLSHPLAPLLAHQRICGRTCQTSRTCYRSHVCICLGSNLATNVVGRHQMGFHRYHIVPQCAHHCASHCQYSLLYVLQLADSCHDYSFTGIENLTFVPINSDCTVVKTAVK